MKGILLSVCIIIFATSKANSQILNIPHRLSGKTVLTLLPGPDNPRNSEGDFITLKNSNILFIYSHFTGDAGGDFGRAYLASRFSTDGGTTWSTKDQVVVKPEGEVNVMSVSLLRLQNGNIALFYGRKNSKADDIPCMRISKDEGKTWSTPVPCITDRKGYFVLDNNRVIQLRNGRMIMPVSLHETQEERIWHKAGQLFCYYSDDNGKTWKSGMEAPNPEHVITQEPGVVELKDGRLFMFIRTNKGFQYGSYSYDQGKSWSAIQPTNIISPLSPASVTRIPSTGDLLMVWNNNGTDQKRTPLNIAVSKDEGKNWSHIKTLENDPKGTFCYTAIHFYKKYILIAYSNWATMGTVIRRFSLKWLYH